MDVLEAALRRIATMLNKNIQESTPARALCTKLADTVVAVHVKDSALAAYFLIDDDALQLLTTTRLEPDVIISGSVVTLARMMGQSGDAAIRDGSLDLSGDGETAQLFQQLLSHAKPDVEEEVSNLIGDVAAYRLGEFARGLGRWGRDARSVMGANVREYLQEESRETPSRCEFEKLSGKVNTLRDDVERIEARINRLGLRP